MKKKIGLWAFWFARRCGVNAILIPSNDVYVDAVALCTEIDKIPQSGEYKRHQVYAKLIKKHPEVSKRDIAMAIELAMVAL